MSVTFSPEYSETDLVTYELRCNEQVIETTPTYAEAYSEAQLHGLLCDDDLCADYGAEISTITDVPSVNVANTNAYHLLGLLGLIQTDGDRPDAFSCGDLSGVCAAEDFLGRVLVAQALNGHDAGVPLHQPVPGRNFYDCGRREGYADDLLPKLADIARWAQNVGRGVQWS